MDDAGIYDDLRLAHAPGAGAGSRSTRSNDAIVYLGNRDPRSRAILAIIAIGPTLGGYALFTLSLRHIPGKVAGLISVIEAPVATLIAVTLLGERLEALQIAGMGMILVAVVLPRLVAQIEGAPQ